jgi:hypothetical protein
VTSRELPRDRVEELPGGLRDLVDRSVEGIAVTRGGLTEPAHLADELERGVVDLVGRCDVCAFTKALDAPAHPGRLPRASAFEGSGRQRGLPDAGHPFEQEVPVREQTDGRRLHGSVVPSDDPLDVHHQPAERSGGLAEGPLRLDHASGFDGRSRSLEPRAARVGQTVGGVSITVPSTSPYAQTSMYGGSIPRFVSAVQIWLR